MICKHCGAEIADGKKFCGECGAPVEVHTVIVRDTPRPNKEEENSKARTVMILGIVGFAVGYLYSAIAGIVLCAIGRKKAKEHEETYGELTGKAKVGGILSLVGLILNIIKVVFTVLAVVYVLVVYGLLIWAIVTAAMNAGGQLDFSSLQDFFTSIPLWM